MSEEPEQLDIPILATKWGETYSYPPLSTIRHLIFNADNNGFDKVICRIGRRVLLKPKAYFKWVEEQNGGAK